MSERILKLKPPIKNKFINILISGDSDTPLQYLTEQSVKMKSKQTRPLENESRTKEQSMKTKESSVLCIEPVIVNKYNKSINYIDILNANSGFSRAIEFKPTIGPKGGRPKKPAHEKKAVKRKKIRRRDLWTSTEDDIDSELEGRYNTIHAASALPSTTSVVEALDVIEKRKKSIKAKLLVKKESLLTQEEEQDIHTRADIYAITTSPDPQFYVLPEDDPLPRPTLHMEDIHVDTSYPPIRKKRRRNYGNANCYVHYHNHEDVFDNTKMLPIGTRLIKPPTKLVELVAQAIDGSPDGLLQVQQIYTFLQNKYPFFRYMERMAINSWRSSIRHALYQKWFRKIRFDLSYISSKGCYWAINHKSNPKEWTLPDSSVGDIEDEYNLEIDPRLHDNVCALLHEEQGYDTKPQQDVVAIAREYGIAVTAGCDYGAQDYIDVETLDDSSVEGHVPSPVREPDPILATCWNNDDVCLSSTESGHGTMSPNPSSSLFMPTESPSYLADDSQVEIRAELLLGTPLNSPCRERSGLLSKTQYSNISNSKIQNSMTDKTPSAFSPIANWTPNWEEFGSYILSPQNSFSTQAFWLGWSVQENDRTRDNVPNLDDQVMEKECLSSDNGNLDSFYNSPTYLCSSDSGSGDDIEIIAEFSKQESKDTTPNLTSLGAIYSCE